MALVLDAAGVSFPRACCTSLTSPASSLKGRARRAFLLPACVGLKVCMPVKVSSVVSRVETARLSRGIMCEQQQEIITGAGEVTEKTWQKLVLGSEVPVLVDFWAPWCGPCRMIAPLIDELARQYGSRIKCLKLNTDESPRIATEYGIRSIPTVMLFNRGEKKDTVIGAVPKSTLTSTIEKYLDW